MRFHISYSNITTDKEIPSEFIIELNKISNLMKDKLSAEWQNIRVTGKERGNLNVL